MTHISEKRRLVFLLLIIAAALRFSRARLAKTVVAQLKDETGREVQSEKAVEVLINLDGKIARTVDQFGVGQVRTATN